MTTLRKLSIQGIRSYSDQSAEVIEFFKPLTIIVGANGSGKTVRGREGECDEATSLNRFRVRCCRRSSKRSSSFAQASNPHSRTKAKASCTIRE
jgi:hypothetical protein